jgi:hypothetical protein
MRFFGIKLIDVHGFFQGSWLVASIRSIKRAVIMEYIFSYAFIGFLWFGVDTKKTVNMTASLVFLLMSTASPQRRSLNV